MSTRERMVAEALKVEDYGMGLGSEEGYLELIGPEESAQFRHDAPHMSGCALVGRGLMRRVGIRHALLDAPYITRMAVQNITDIAREAGALTEGLRILDAVPVEGDIWHVYAPEHVYTIVRVDLVRPGLWYVESIDGGQGPEGSRIARVTRHIAKTARGLLDTRMDTSVQRDVVGVVDMDRVGAYYIADPATAITYGGLVS